MLRAVDRSAITALRTRMLSRDTADGGAGPDLTCEELLEVLQTGPRLDAYRDGWIIPETLSGDVCQKASRRPTER